MCEVPVFYATTDGQTRLIAEYLAGALRSQGLESIALDVTHVDAWSLDGRRVRAVVLGASVHAGKHQTAAADFVAAHRQWFNEVPSVFFSVSLSIASSNPTEMEAARSIAKKFVDQTGWQPTRVVCFPGRLAYTRYSWLKRMLMRRIARKEGGPTDTRRDHELTNWTDVTALATDIASLARPPVALS
jgi:menaquinone-dependent protoporphyrinogen oxidase